MHSYRHEGMCLDGASGAPDGAPSGNQQATVIRGCYRILASAEPAAESLASIPFAKLDRVLLADALIRAGWRPPDAR